MSDALSGRYIGDQFTYLITAMLTGAVVVARKTLLSDAPAIVIV